MHGILPPFRLRQPDGHKYELRFSQQAALGAFLHHDHRTLLDGELRAIYGHHPLAFQEVIDRGRFRMHRDALAGLDLFDRVQLAFVIGVCRESGTLSEAGRKLYAATREKRKVQNDADRLRKYLARFGLDWESCQA